MSSEDVAIPAVPEAKVQAPPFSAKYIRRALWILMIVSLLNFLDRQVMNILAEPIKRDLGLSDTQLGLLAGLAFALFYTVLGLPLARFADNPKNSRTTLMAICVAVWSGMTVLCGFAQNFSQLLLARIGVGVGEAGSAPVAHSLISDMVPREKHASAMAFFGIGMPIGGLLGMVVGGIVTDLYGWRVAFMLVGAPGLLFAFVVQFFLKEPRRLVTATEAVKPPPEAARTLGEVLKEVFASKAFVYILLASMFVYFLGYGKTVWQAVLFIRTHGLSAGQVGVWLGLTGGIAGMIGMYLGGFFADRLGVRRARLLLAAPALGMAIGAPFAVAGYLHQDWRIAMAFIFVPAVAANMYYGPAFSCVQRLVSPGSRAMASAIMLFIINLVGLGFGPLFFGMLSDYLAPIAQDQSVRWVLTGAAAMNVIPAVLLWLAGRHLERELKV